MDRRHRVVVFVFALILSFVAGPPALGQYDSSASAMSDPAKKVTVKGVVVDKESLPVIGATVFLEGDYNNGAMTDAYGNYSLDIPEGEWTLHIICLGYEEVIKTIDTNRPSDLEIVTVLKETFYIRTWIKMITIFLGIVLLFVVIRIIIKMKKRHADELPESTIIEAKKEDEIPIVKVESSRSTVGLSRGKLLQGGKYAVDGTLGQGGFGITYSAMQVALRRKVAIKEFFVKDFCERDEDGNRVKLVTASGNKELVSRYRAKFIREAQMIASLEHPHIIKIYDVFEENGTAYYVMEYHGGGSLMGLVRESGPLELPLALDYIAQIGDALSYLHNHNLLHFDVKPSNILLGNAGKAILIDFGISKHYDESGSQTSSTPVGISKGYAPLEQYQQSEVTSFTPATDIYALSATLYTLLTGEIPPSASEVNEDGLPDMPERIPQTIRAAIVKGMSPRRKQRPQSVKAFMDLLAGKTHPDEETEIM